QEPARTRPIPLTPDNTRSKADVFVVQHQTLDDEVATVAAYIAHYLEKRPKLPAGQVIVLAPRRFIGNAIRDALIARGLNSMSYFTEDPVQPPAAANGFALLTLLVDPLDRAALRAWLGMGSSTGLRGGYRRVVAAAQSNAVEPSEILRRLDAGALQVPFSLPLVERWRALNAALEPLKELTGLELVRTIWPPQDESCDDIRLVAEEIAVNASDPRTILEELRLAITQPYLPDSDSDVIRVMSLHKSKGLTASLVVIAGAMAGAVPHIDTALPPAEQDAQLLEQRRLFYVAITRATDTLVISAPLLLPFAQAMQAQVTVVRRRFVGRESLSVVAMSPFVAELGPSCPATITTTAWRGAVGF
ncbi:MAG: 3'-5' exonuclease, partial [Gemmatimonadales bacterium]